jgi:hypothetical protein
MNSRTSNLFPHIVFRQPIRKHSLLRPSKGTLHIETIDSKEKTHFLPLRDTLYCPNMPGTLVSIGKLDDARHTIHIEKRVMTIAKHGRTLAHIPKTNGLYQITGHENAYSTTDVILSLYEAHCRLGHLNYQYPETLFANHTVKGAKLDLKRIERVECIVFMPSEILELTSCQEFWRLNSH